MFSSHSTDVQVFAPARCFGVFLQEPAAWTEATRGERFRSGQELDSRIAALFSVLSLALQTPNQLGKHGLKSSEWKRFTSKLLLIKLKP